MSSSHSSTSASSSSQQPPSTPIHLLLLQKWVAGSLGGIAQFLVCHPLDTIKAQQQFGMTSSVRQGVSQNGLLALYRGGLLPLATSGFTFGWFFAVQEFCRKHIVEPYCCRPPPAHDDSTTLHSSGSSGSGRGVSLDINSLAVPLLSGILTAPLVAVVVTPIEGWKVRRQLNKIVRGGSGGDIDNIKPSSSSLSSTTPSRIRHVQFLYRGGLVIAMQRCCGFPLYFAGYQGTRSIMENHVRPYFQTSPPTSATSTSSSLLFEVFSICISGAVSGVGYWVAAYPWDTLKCVLMGDESLCVRDAIRRIVGSSPTPMVSSSTGREMRWVPYIRTWYRGFGVAALRTVIATPTTWLAVEGASRIVRL